MNINSDNQINDQPNNNDQIPETTNSVSNKRKWGYAILSGLLVFLLFSNSFYTFINGLFVIVDLPSLVDCNQCLNIWGNFIITLFFVLMLRLIMA